MPIERSGLWWRMPIVTSERIDAYLHLKVGDVIAVLWGNNPVHWEYGEVISVLQHHDFTYSVTAEMRMENGAVKSMYKFDQCVRLIPVAADEWKEKYTGR